MTSSFSERHPTVEELIEAIEGELDKSRRADVAAHLELCWGCRHKHERLLRTIDRYAEMAASGWQSDVDRSRWNGFASRLAAAAASQAPPARRISPFAGFSLAGAVAALLAVLLWPVPIVSAKEAMARSAAAEKAMDLRSPRAVTVQRIQVEANSRRAKGKVWRAAAHRPRWQPEAGGDAALWRELETLYEQNDLDFSRPVSATNHAAWVAENGAAREQVDQEGGYLRIRMRSADAPEPGEIVEAELVVRATDWHPIEQTWMVHGDGGTRQYRIVETALEVTALTPQLANWMDGIEPATISELEVTPALDPQETREPTLLEVPAIPVLTAEELNEAEVDALVAVHETGAADRDGARVERQAQRVLITTYPEDPTHLVALRHAIKTSRPIEIVAVEENDLDHPGPPTVNVVPLAPQPPLFFDSLVQMVGRERAANLVVSAQHAALRRVLVEVAALADLAQRFPDAARSALSPQAAARLNRLGEAHRQAARLAWAQVDANSRPLLAATGVELPEQSAAGALCRWDGTATLLASSVSRLEELYSRGFTALAGGSPDLGQISPFNWRQEIVGLHANVGAALAGKCEP